MKKILLGMALLAGITSCSKEDVSGEEDKVKTGLYKAVATYSSSTAKEKEPINVQLTFGTQGSLYTYDLNGEIKKVDGKVYLVNDYASVKDTTITVFTDNNDLLSFALFAVSLEDGNKLSYDVTIYRDNKKVESFNNKDVVINLGESKEVVY